MTEIRRFDLEDIEFALEQTSREGWAASRVEFRILLEHDPRGCFIATSAGSAIGMVTTTRFGEVGWIGNLIVEPEHRGREVGRALMTRGLDRLRAEAVTTILLEADPLGIPLYRSLGFEEEFESSRYALDALPDRQAPVPGECSKMTLEDLDAVASLDALACGANRERYLQLKFRHSEVALVRRRGDSVVAALMAASTPQGLRVGPSMALDRSDAEVILRAAIASARQSPVLIGVPAPNPFAASILEELGFRRTPPSLRMRLGRAVSGSHPKYSYAIASGAVG